MKLTEALPFNKYFYILNLQKIIRIKNPYAIFNNIGAQINIQLNLIF